MRKIILASSSPRRQDLMKLLDIPFEIVVSNFDESTIKIKNPRKFVEMQSLKKAEVVAKKFRDAIIIGSDSAVVVDGQILGKPKDDKDAEKALKQLSGTRHVIITGLAIIDQKQNKVVITSNKSYVKMKKLTTSEIKGYLKTGEHKDKAGSYSVTMKGSMFVEKVVGDVTAIIGLPMRQLVEELRKMGVKIHN